MLIFNRTARSLLVIQELGSAFCSIYVRLSRPAVRKSLRKSLALRRCVVVLHVMLVFFLVFVSLTYESLRCVYSGCWLVRMSAAILRRPVQILIVCSTSKICMWW